MTARGFTFKNIDLYESDALRFKVDGNSLVPPFSALAGIGDNAARNIAPRVNLENSSPSRISSKIEGEQNRRGAVNKWDASAVCRRATSCHCSDSCHSFMAVTP